MAGLPGTGKTTIAREIARHFGMALLELDRLEAPLLAQGISGDAIAWSGYAALTALAEANLELGLGVVLDSVAWTNEIRADWRDLAERKRVEFRAIEVICSDARVYQKRIQARASKVIGWERIDEARRRYEPWNTARLVLDSVGDRGDLLSEALTYVATGGPTR